MWWSVAAVAIVLAACGGGGDGSDGAGESPPVETATPAVETAPTEESAAAAGETAEIVNADPVLVDLDDFRITTDTTVFRAGTIDFEVTNPDDVPHEFAVARGDDYESLPQRPNGAVDEEALGADFLGKTPALVSALGATREISFDLEPGNYVFFCNLGTAVAHASRGQVLSVTVVA